VAVFLLTFFNWGNTPKKCGPIGEVKGLNEKKVSKKALKFSKLFLPD
jgi:hypothetical protein